MKSNTASSKERASRKVTGIDDEINKIIHYLKIKMSKVRAEKNHSIDEAIYTIAANCDNGINKAGWYNYLSISRCDWKLNPRVVDAICDYLDEDPDIFSYLSKLRKTRKYIINSGISGQADKLIDIVREDVGFALPNAVDLVAV
ncbi:hypothetical protein [Roseofilum capinflatum]|uniref:Uncharacterized protein n=1 Tax=Roseofilum capinflatum BLCC-M114 TaxID=3022440 RepID=A0ABT7B6H3_9CYAN|nr:hypothetical protein [Roseofilum capinflatum]MDJ1174710.1 hypothetical protein [Roseofilum capinflatum BLCC-M114]